MKLLRNLKPITVAGVWILGASLGLVAAPLEQVAAQGLAPGFQPIDGSDLGCTVRSSGSLLIIAGSPDGGHVDEFSCSVTGHAPKSLDLASDRFDKGFVKTKQFGDIQIFFIPGHADVIAMKQDQKEQIIKLIGQ